LEAKSAAVQIKSPASRAHEAYELRCAQFAGNSAACVLKKAPGCRLLFPDCIA